MSVLKSIYYSVCSLLPMKLIKSAGPRGTLFPYQHTVSDEPLPHIRHLYACKNQKQFSDDLDFLLKHYQPVSLADITGAIKTHSVLPRRSFLLSFDDGLRGVHDIIAPILEKKGVPACFFINPAFIDNRVLFYRCKISLLIEELLEKGDRVSYLGLYQGILGTGKKTLKETIVSLRSISESNAWKLDKIAENAGISFDAFLRTNRPFLTRDQLISLHQRGFSIGAHSMDHPYFQHLSITEQVNQVTGSCRYVNDLLETGDCCFSFPHSDRGLAAALFRELRELNVPLFFGVQNQKEELGNRMVHRFNAERPEIKLESLVKGIWLLTGLRKLAGMNRVRRN